MGGPGLHGRPGARGDNYCIPAFVGHQASLNLGVLLTGPTGTSKSTSLKVARALLGGTNLTARQVGAGSGEGLLGNYLERDTAGPKGQEPLVPRADRRCFLYVDEVGQVAALKQRSGSTLMPQLRSALMGEALITTNAEVDRNRFLAGGTYRLTAIMGVQPAMAGVLLEDTEEGGPQRFLWVPSPDALVPDVEPDWPTTLVPWRLPVDRDRTHTDPLTGSVEIGYPEHVRAAARAEQRKRHRSGLKATDPGEPRLPHSPEGGGWGGAAPWAPRCHRGGGLGGLRDSDAAVVEPAARVWRTSPRTR